MRCWRGRDKWYHGICYKYFNSSLWKSTTFNTNTTLNTFTGFWLFQNMFSCPILGVDSQCVSPLWCHHYNPRYFHFNLDNSDNFVTSSRLLGGLPATSLVHNRISSSCRTIVQLNSYLIELFTPKRRSQVVEMKRIYLHIIDTFL